MKKIYVLSIAMICLQYVSAQISQGGKPYGLTHSFTTDLTVEKLEAVSLEWQRKAERNEANNGTIELIAKNIKTDLNLDNSGTWETLKNGDRIWRLKITGDRAIGLNAMFKDFYLPKGAKMFVYEPGFNQIIGAFTDFNNHESKIFSTEIIFGNSMIIEYYEPRSQKNKGTFTIEAIGSFFKDVQNFKDVDSFGESEYCQVNINCSPEGDNWQDEKKGVARILVTSPSGSGWCTGSLVNNTNLDCKPYFLTAYHCGNSSTATNFNQWVFYFNYEFSGCSNSTEPSSNTMNGATLIARANDLNSTSISSDFLLLELNNVVPQSYDVYYNGWSLQSAGPSSGVAIHHPAGDVKKISNYSTTPTTVGVSWSGSGYAIIPGQTHWSVSWSSTTNGFGVSEGGSSGSPLFNNNGYVIGTLTGGGSECDEPNNKDQYGKMSYHWESNSTSQARQLKPWLDPSNSGVNVFDGTYAPCTAATTNDAALDQIVNPKGDLCDYSFEPKVGLKNNGALPLTSATITYQLNSETPVTYNWTGSLTRGDSEIVDLAAGNTTTESNSITITVSNPNGVTDEDNSNNTISSTFNANVQKALPFIETFQNNSFPSLSWFIANPDNNRTWEVFDDGSFGTSSTCMYIDNWDYEAEGQYDWFVSDAYNLSDTLDNELYFDLAYTFYKQTNGSNISYDSLGIAYSLDCGESFYWLWKQGGDSLATLQGGLGEEFIPQNNEWETRTIALNESILGQPSVIFAFIAENGYGNNLYIDNIGVGHQLLGVDDEKETFNNINLYPNPTNDYLNLSIDLKKKTVVNYEIFNTIGQNMVTKQLNASAINEKIDVSSFSKGVYYVKVNANATQQVLKFVKE